MDEFLTRNFFLMNSVLAVVAGLAAWRIAHVLPRGWLIGTFGIVPVIIVSWLFAALVTFVFTLGFEPSTSNFGGAIAFYLESGIELLGAALAIATYLIARGRRRQPSSA
jgi:hypothetical protein